MITLRGITKNNLKGPIHEPHLSSHSSNKVLWSLARLNDVRGISMLSTKIEEQRNQVTSRYFIPHILFLWKFRKVWSTVKKINQVRENWFKIYLVPKCIQIMLSSIKKKAVWQCWYSDKFVNTCITHCANCVRFWL